MIAYVIVAIFLVLQVESLKDYGSQNKDSLAHLLHAFFDYWAWRHDYSNQVASIRMGGVSYHHTIVYVRLMIEWASFIPQPVREILSLLLQNI